MSDEGSEVLVDLETLIEWGIIPECFPLPINIHDRVGSVKETKVWGVRKSDHVPKKIVDLMSKFGVGEQISNSIR